MLGIWVSGFCAAGAMFIAMEASVSWGVVLIIISIANGIIGAKECI